MAWQPLSVTLLRHRKPRSKRLRAGVRRQNFLSAAVEVKGLFRDWTFRLIDVTGPIERATWPAIQKAGAEFRSEHRLDWDAYRLHILQVSAPIRWRAGGSELKRLSKKLDLSVPTIIRRRREVPLAIARAVVLQGCVLVSENQ